MASVEEVKAQLNAAVQAAQKATEVLTTASSSVDQAVQLTNEAARGSSHDKLNEALRAFAEAKSRLEDATGAAKQGIDTAQQYLSVS
ncbi:MAG: hypothetical protein P8Z68_01610 [Kineosporiaceae bacterium]